MMLDLPVNTRLLIELEKRFQIRCCAALALALGCAPVPLPDGDRRVALRETAELVILPTHAELSERADILAELMARLEPEAEADDVSTLLQAFRNVRAPLKEAEAFGFGPAVELHSAADLDQLPIDPRKIEGELAGSVELNAQYVETLGANKRGLHAIEYLLFSSQDHALAAEVLLDSEAGARRRQFLSAAAQVVARHAGELKAAWEPEEGGFFTRFTEPGAKDSVSKTVQGALDTLLNESIYLAEQVANVKLARPLGADSGAAVSPALQESELSGLSIADMLSNLRGIRNVYLGRRDGQQGLGLSSLVHAKSPGADARTRQALAEVEQSLLDLPEPFTTALLESPEAVQSAFDSVKNLKRLLATEVLGILGASLKLNDNDGD